MKISAFSNRRTHAEVVMKEFDRISLAIQLRMNLCVESINQLERLGRGDLAAPVRSELIGLTHTQALIESRTVAIDGGELV